jgi:hypothetical protein
MLRPVLSACFVRPGVSRLFATTSVLQQENPEELDRLFSKISLEVRGHDKAVLQSYTVFLKVSLDLFIISNSLLECV